MDDVQPTDSVTLSIVGYEDNEYMERGGTKRLVRAVIPVDKLEEEVKHFMAALERIIGDLSERVGNYSMDTITVSAEVNAKGTVSLLGTGGEMGGKGGLSFTFKRSNTHKSEV